jgi:hypothetical protein
MSVFWRAAFRAMYRLLAFMDPLIRWFWRRFGIGNVVELTVERQEGGEDRARLLGLLHAGDGLYLGHPNGPVGWTSDLEAAGVGIIRWPGGQLMRVRAVRLPAGMERGDAIRATGQHPFPGNLVYRLGRGHVRSVGVFFRITPRDDEPRDEEPRDEGPRDEEAG